VLSDTTDFDLIVIGGGPAGVTAALRARELGAQVALVERGRMGGTCTNDGCAPTRVLARAARLVRNYRQFGDYGLIGEPPSVDLPALLARTQETVYRLQEKKQLLDHMARAGVRVLAGVGEPRFTDAHSLALPDGQQLKGKYILLCAGGHARRLNFPGSHLVLTHSDVWTLTRLPASLAVIGGAATGCQLASIFNAFGTRVTVLDVAPRLLAAEDEAVSQAVTEGFDRCGIQIVTGIGGIERIDELEGGLQLSFTLGGQVQRLQAEAVVMAVGWVGNIESLNLEAAGVQTERGYVVVDDCLRTHAPNIFAAGDIIGRVMLVQSATHEARVAVENALLGRRQSFKHRIVPHGGFTDPEYGSVGLTERQAAELPGGYAVATVPYADMDRAVIDGLTAGFCKLIVARDSRHMLGAHVVGEQAVEVVQMIAAGMAAHLHVEQLAELELAYPTYTAIVGLAARQLARELQMTPVSAEWQTLERLERRPAEWERMDL
jgi:pyruvate/2-oxoglutarate dehydrogenase complex dihydrolipoamide dehydrogenase (E3) component